MSKAKSSQTTADPETEIDFSDIPEQTDFSRAVRGQAGLKLVMELTRLRQALRTIRDWPATDQEPAQVAQAMRDEASRTLAELTSQPGGPAA